jgi:hypothetical protein
MSAPTIHRMVRGFASWLGILAVLVPLIVSSVHRPLPVDVDPSRTHAQFTAVLDDGEAICHAAPDPVGKPQPPERAPSSPYRADCPICWALQHIFTLAPPLGPVLPCPTLVALSVSIAHSVLFVAQATTWNAQPRAPPELI